MTNPDDEQRHTGAGLWFFFIYVVFYGGFVLLSAFSPAAMSAKVFGVTLAIVYGFGLIVLAFVLALIYMALTSSRERDAEDRS